MTTSDGTGIVHIAPAFGDDDYQVGKKYNLPIIRPVNKSGKFDDVVTDYKGKFVEVKLSEYLGKWVLLCFYPGDFTFV